jgi:hypothetical protein
VETARAASRNAELIELRRRYLEKAYCAQIRSDKHLLRSRIAQMQPSAQRAFSQSRLEKLRDKEREIRTPVSDE